MSEVKCTLSNDELIRKSNELVSKLCETGGHSWCLRVPVDLNNDPDIIFTELGNRVLSLSAQLSEAQGEIERLKENNDKFMWQVRDTCQRAEKAEAELAELRERMKGIEGFIYHITLDLQRHRELTDQQKDGLFNRAYHWYVELDVEKAIKAACEGK